MAKKRPAKEPSLALLRDQIDRLDREIVKRLNERAALAVKVGQLKSANGLEVYAPEREEEVLKKVAAAGTGPLSADCLRAIYREIISGSRSVEKHVRVAYLGPAYSYSHQAASRRFGQCVELVAVATIAAVFEEVNHGYADYGIVPIENSTDGRIADTLEMFTRLAVKMCGEIELPIHHYLLGRGARSDVQEVYSRPQALSQCRNWLAKHLPSARLVEVTSTSTAAQLAHDKPGAAAIASQQAGVRYGLDVLAADIEDDPGNTTRFAVIGLSSGRKTGKDDTAIMFEVAHQPGTLADAMAIFKKNRLNLTWIESFPIRGAKGRYFFFVELEGHESDLKVRKALAQLAKKSLQVKVLGSYAQCG
jgi:chorismate mutase/prephenate dehydratase